MEKFNVTMGYDDASMTAEQGLLATNPACDRVRFGVNTIVVGSLCLFGLIGNVLSIVVLQKDRSNRVASFLLQSLAVADNALLLLAFFVLSLFHSLLPYIGEIYIWSQAMPYTVKYIQPLAYMAQTATIWITVLLGINRYIAVCKPFDVSSWCCMKYTRAQVIAAVLFSICFNMPRFFQVEVVHHIVFRNGEPRLGVGLNLSSISEKSTFGLVYTTGIYTILVLLLPFVLLVFMNIRVILELRAVRRRGSFMSTQPILSDYNITLIMIIIIVMFLLCHTPDRVLNILKLVRSGDFSCSEEYFYANLVCNSLVIMNSSVNFVVYCLFRKRFRKILHSVICLKFSSLSKTFLVRSNSSDQKKLSLVRLGQPLNEENKL